MTRKRRSFTPEFKQEEASLLLDQGYTMALKPQVNLLFSKNRSSARSQTIKGLLSEEGIVVGRFKVRRLMSELGQICKQPRPHAYKQATDERPISRTIWLVNLP
jgi:transposase-like protein